jgi:hypothetical protein
VRGTVQGPKVEGEICDNGVGTYFAGPNDFAWMKYLQVFDTMTTPGGELYVSNPDGLSVYGFLLHKPEDALSGRLSIWGVAVPAPEVGSYDSATHCGSLGFEVTLPIPPDITCPNPVPPCDPGCAPGPGEALLCEPMKPRWVYQAHSAPGLCLSDADPAQGSWVLTITAVSPVADPAKYLQYKTQGHLQATLVNRDDPSDSVVLSLDF